MRFSVLGFRSDLRIELQAPVLTLNEEIPKLKVFKTMSISILIRVIF